MDRIARILHLSRRKRIGPTMKENSSFSAAVSTHALDAGAVLVTCDSHFLAVPGLRIWEKIDDPALVSVERFDRFELGGQALGADGYRRLELGREERHLELLDQPAVILDGCFLLRRIAGLESYEEFVQRR